MSMVVEGIEGVKALAGKEWGTTAWREITQEQVNTFAAATGDHQWIHVDVEKAKRGPFKGTIAHGFLTLSLIPVLFAEIAVVSDVSMVLNYGLNKVRFPAPAPVGAKLRGQVTNLAVDDVGGGGGGGGGDRVQATNLITIEMEGAPKPVCVAEFLLRYYA